MKPIQLDRLRKTLQRIEEKLQMQASEVCSAQNLLEINVSGELSLSINDEEMKLKWRTSKSLELFLYLLHNFGKFIHKTELMEILWPEMEEEKAFPQLYTAIYHTRKTLHPVREHISIKNVSGGYKLVVQNSLINVVEWEKAIQSLPSLHSTTIREYEKIMHLYKEPYLT